MGVCRRRALVGLGLLCGDFACSQSTWNSSVYVETSLCALETAERRRREGVLSQGARWLGFQNELLNAEELVCNGQCVSRRLNKQRGAS